MSNKRDQKKEKKKWEKPLITKMKLSETLKHEVGGELDHDRAS